MGLTEDMADELAQEVLALVEKGADVLVVDKLSEVLGASSQTLQEAYLTAIRVRRAEKRARVLLAETHAKLPK